MRILLVALYGLILTAHGQNPSYNQPYRPQVHFSPQKNWTNDPNGLVYFDGEYHLFFQYNPFGDQWGHMSWGHAVSTDLLHWKELPVALPEENGTMIFTGSVVVDHNNTSGFCTQGPCMVAVYTGHQADGRRQTQNLAFSRDDGRTWKKYQRNPVLDLHLKDFRDPSVFWSDESQKWVMAVSLPMERQVRFYASANLKDWAKLSDFGPAGDVNGDWECPDLLQIPSADGQHSMWALKVGLNPGAPQGGSGEQYFLGNFDGKTFTASNRPGAHGLTNYGKDDYCAISFNGLPAGQKPVLLGWMSNWQYAAKLPTAPWRGQMSLPRRLSLVDDASGLALQQKPITGPLRAKEVTLALDEKTAIPYEAEINFGHPSVARFGVRLYSDEQHFTEIAFDTARNEFSIDRTQSGAEVGKTFPIKTVAPLVAGRGYDLRLVVDRASIEAYAQNGTIAMTNLVFPLSPGNTIKIFPETAKPSGKMWQLNPIW